MVKAQTDSPPRDRPDKHRPERTCVGCGRRDEPGKLVRVVLGPDGTVAFDLAGHAFGRGAHVHGTAVCLAQAARKGLARSFRTEVRVTPGQLQDMLAQAAERRLTGVVLSASRSGVAVVGRMAVESALQREQLEQIVVACDVAPDSLSHALSEAVAAGRALAWGTKSSLGALLGRDEVTMIGIRSRRVASAIADTHRLADGARAGAEVR